MGSQGQPAENAAGLALDRSLVFALDLPLPHREGPQPCKAR